MEYPLFATGLLPAFPWVLLIFLYAFSLIASILRRKGPVVSQVSPEGGESL
jgi:hypothetical protein